MTSKTEIHKRRIGSVVIFDLFGELTDDEIDAIKDFMEKNIQRGGFRNVILNAQHILHIDQLALRKILVPLERPHRKAVYCSSPELLNVFLNTYLPEKTVVCKNEAEISDVFGLYLVEKDKFIFKGERRKSKRIDVAIPVTIKIEVSPTDVQSTTALITNLSEGGFYAEYLDLQSATTLKNVREVKSRPAQAVFRPPLASADKTFRIEIIRVEVASRQTGVAVKFIEQPQ